MMRVQNFYHCNANNIGDRLCGPAQYIWPADYEAIPLREPEKFGTNIVLGGGQIFQQVVDLVAKIKEHSPESRVVVWGVGLPPLGKNSSVVKDIAGSVELFGTRDYNYRDFLSFVPCASCVSELFDLMPPPTHDVVAFLHQRKGNTITLPNSVPRISNEMQDPKSVIEFIASGDTVLTSSYHGVYWAQLLGRRVICVPYGPKFNTFQFPPTFASLLSTASRAPEILEEYRQINMNFAKRAENVWS